MPDTKKGRSASELRAAATAIAAGTQAYAEEIIFINPEPGEPGYFDVSWLPSHPRHVTSMALAWQ